MIKTVKEKAARIGRQKIRCVITIRVSQLVFSNDGVLEPGSILTLCFEKSGRIATSNQILFDPSFDDVNPIVSQKNLKYTTIQVDEKLELAVSLYKNLDTNEYQAKRGKITVRQLQRNVTLGVDAFKVIGTYVLLLHETVEKLSATPSSCIEETLCMDGLPGSSLQVNISMKIVNKKRGSFQLRKSIATLSKGALHGWSSHHHHTGAGRKDHATAGRDEDETGSNASDNSDSSVFSTLGATFYYEDLEEYGGGREAAVTTLGGTASSPQRLRQHQQQTQEHSEISDYEAVYSDATNSFSRLAGKLPSRRSSGLHVMEVAMNETSSENILPLPKPAPKRPSLPDPPPMRCSSTQQDATSLSGAHSQNPEEQGGCESTGTAGTEHLMLNSQNLLEALIPPTLCIPLSHTVNNDPVEEAAVKGTLSPNSPSAARHLCRTPAAARAGQRHRESISSYASVETDWSPLLAGSLDHVNGGLGDRFTLSAGKAGSRSSLSSPCVTGHGKSRDRLSSASSTSALSPLTPAQQQLLQQSSSRRSSAHSPDAVENYCTTAAATVGDDSVRTPASSMAFSPNDRLVLVHDTARQATEEAFRHYEQEVQVRDERIAVLEKRLKDALEAHRTELESTYSSLHSVEAEALLLRKQLHQYEQCARVMKETELSLTAKENVGKGVEGAISTTAESSFVPSDAPLPHDIETTNISAPTAQAAVQTDMPTELPIHSADVAAVNTTPDEHEPPSLQRIQEEDDHSNSTEPEQQHSVGDQIQEGISSPESVAVLVSEFGRTSAEVHLLAQELAYYKQLASEAQRAKTEETLASREAATAVVQACMRRAECEQQLTDAMFQVQELHRRLAQLQIEHDSEIRRSYALRARLQLYAEKLSAMEVDYTLSIHQLEESDIIKENDETKVESL